MKEYKSISSQMYEITKPVGSSIGGDLEYYYDKIKDLKGPILEAGVGTGRLLIPYAQKGLRIEGVDLSPHMLDICRSNCQAHKVQAQLYLQDLVKLQLDQAYEAIIMPTGSFCLITDLDDARKVLKSFGDHLAPGGRIILDLAFPLDFEKGEDLYLTRIDEDSSIVLYSHKRRLDLVEQKTYCLNKYEKWQHDQLIATEISEFNMVWYGINEFHYLLKDLGFGQIDYEFGYGDENDQSLATFTIAK